MPRSKREWALRKLKMAQDALDRAGKHLQEIAVIYQKDYIDIYNQVSKVQEFILIPYECVKRLRDSF